VIDVSDIEKVAKPTLEAPLLIRVVRNGSASFIAVTGESEIQFP